MPKKTNAESGAVVYLCNTPTCTLGASGEAGRFTGGMRFERDENDIESLVPAEGFCPNCHQEGTAIVAGED